MRADLSEATLNEARFDFANLAGADLAESKLVGASFVDADLSGADFTAADLRDVVLAGASVEGATLAGADLRGADVSGALGRPGSISGARIDAATVERSGLDDEQVIGFWNDGVLLDDLDLLSPAVQEACRHSDQVIDRGAPTSRGLAMLDLEARRQLSSIKRRRLTPVPHESLHRLDYISSLPPKSEYPEDSDPPPMSLPPRSLPPPTEVARKLSGQFSVASLVPPAFDEKPEAPEPVVEGVPESMRRGYRRGSRVLGTTLEERLGGGHLGEVFRAKSDDGSTVAVKIFERMKLDRGLSVTAFRHGVETIQRLEREGVPGLPRLHRVADNRLAFVFEFAENGSLDDFPALGWDAPRSVALFRDIARLVDGVHQAGVLHLALKPSNILLDDNLEPLLSDSQMVDFISLVDSSSDAGGYGPYAAPEELLGYGTQSPTADVYSLGRVLWFMLSGQAPSEPATRVATLRDLDAAPVGLRRIIRKATLPDASQRYQRVGELLSDLEHYETGNVGIESVAPRPIATGRRASSLVQTKAWVPAKSPREAPKRGPTKPPGTLEHVEWLPRTTELGLAAAGLVLVTLGVLRTMAVALPTPSNLTQSHVIIALGFGLLAFAPPGRGFENERRGRIALAIALAAGVMLLDPRPLAEARLERTLKTGTLDMKARAIQRLVRLGLRDFSYANLAGADLSGLDLANANFEGANLTEANLEGSALMESRFEGANLDGARLAGANLHLAEVEGAISFASTGCDRDTSFPPGWTCAGGLTARGGEAPPPEAGGAAILTQ